MHSQLAPPSRESGLVTAGTQIQAAGGIDGGCDTTGAAAKPSVLSAGQNGGIGADHHARPARPVSANVASSDRTFASASHTSPAQELISGEEAPAGLSHQASTKRKVDGEAAYVAGHGDVHYKIPQRCSQGTM